MNPPLPSTDERHRLAARTTQGDDEAAARTMEIYRHVIARTIRKTQIPKGWPQLTPQQRDNLIEELIHGVIHRLSRKKVPGDPGQFPATALVQKICKHMVLDEARSTFRHSTDFLHMKARDAGLEEQVFRSEARSDDPSVAESIEDEEVAQVIQAAVDQLPGELRDVAILFFYRDQNISQIARILGKTRQHVRDVLLRDAQAILTTRLAPIVGPNLPM